MTGEGAEAWLDRMLACKLPKPGRMTLAPMLKDDGKLIGDFTLANLGEAGEWFIAGSGIAEQYPYALVRDASAARRLGRDRGARPRS